MRKKEATNDHGMAVKERIRRERNSKAKIVMTFINGNGVTDIYIYKYRCIHAKRMALKDVKKNGEERKKENRENELKERNPSQQRNKEL